MLTRREVRFQNSQSKVALSISILQCDVFTAQVSIHKNDPSTQILYKLLHQRYLLPQVRCDLSEIGNYLVKQSIYITKTSDHLGGINHFFW